MQQSPSLPNIGWRNFLSRRPLLILSMAFWLLALGLWLTPLVAQAQTSNGSVKLQARSFFEGHFKYGDWLPIEVSLENFGEALDAQVEVVINNNYNGSISNTTFRREISLGQRANKRFTLYTQPFVQTTNVSRSVQYEAKVQLKAAGKVLDEKTVKLVSIQPGDYLVGAMVTDLSALSVLNNLKVGATRNRVLIVPFTLNDIPDRAEGLRSLNSIVISEVSTDGLSATQRAALKNWVSTGGQLLLMGGNSWGRVREAFDPTILPFDVLDFVNVSDVSALLPVPGEQRTPLSRPTALARGQVLQGARALSYTATPNGSAPMLVERRIGAGRVVAAAVDMASPVLMDWPGTNRVWQDVFNFNAGNYNNLYSEQNPHLKNAADMLGFISSVPDLQLPNLLPFLLIFAIYALLISPLNYLVLKRMNRLGWAWATIPLSIAAATALTFSLTSNQAPGQVLVNQMSIIQAGANQDTAQVRSYATIFSPEERSYQVAPDVPEGVLSPLLLPMNRLSSNNNTEQEANRVIVQGDKSRVDGIPIAQWTAQGLSTEAFLPGRQFQIDSGLYFQRDKDQNDNVKIVGTLRNSTGWNLRNALLILGDLPPVKLKDLIEPGEAVSVEYSLPSPTAAVPAYCASASGSFTGSSISYQMPGDRISTLLQQDRGDNRREDRLLSNRAGFIKKMFDSGRYSPLNPNRGLDLVGWLDQNPLPVSIDGVTTQPKSSQVLVSRLPISYEARNGESPLFIPGQYFWPDISSNDSGLLAATTRTDRDDQVCVSKGSVVSQYRLPVEQGPIRVKKLTLYLNSFSATSQRNPTLPERIELYDWQSGKWQALSGLQNSAIPQQGSQLSAPPPKANDIPDPARFVEFQTGRILLRFGQDSSNQSLLTQFSLAAEGSR